MRIELDDKMKIDKVQELFNCLFPFLKIEFFEKAIRIQNNNALRRHIGNGSRLLGEFIAEGRSFNFITITPDMTANELEASFNNVHGLHTQVFRKSGNVWLEPTVTEEWTLEQQNMQGETLTNQIANSRKIYAN